MTDSFLKQIYMYSTKTLFFVLLPFFSFSQCWNLVWEDDFTGSSLNTANWSYQTGGGGWGNNELQYYQAANVSVGSGMLSITAKEESVSGYNYTSARIRTKNQGDWTYGKFEASIKLPEGQGIWPAFWMLPTDNIYGIWPRSGELDIMEYLGHDTDRIYGTLHYSTSPSDGTHHFQGGNYNLPSGDFTQAFHLFSMEWDPTEVRWYIDGTLYFSRNTTDISPNFWPFDRDFHFLLNVAVGGNWPGAPDGTTMFPQTMEVDYVRVYQQLSQVVIDGKEQVQPNATSESYSLPSIAGTSYIWSVTNGSIQSGQGTNSIEVDWLASDGQVSCSLNNACGTQVLNLDVDVTANLITNWGFEDYYFSWNRAENNGADVDFWVSSSDFYSGSHAAQVQVNSTGINNWDVQLSRNDFSLNAGTEYTLSFWGKYQGGTQAIAMSVIDASTFASYASQGFVLNNTWAEYTYTFTSPVTSSNLLYTIDLGQNTGTYFLDHISLGETSLLPVEFLTFDAINQENQVDLKWTTLRESNNAYFEIQKLEDSNWKILGRIDSQGDSEFPQHYSFQDKNPQNSWNYYRLKQVDWNDDFSYSNIAKAYIELKEDAFRIYPNPTKEILWIPMVEKFQLLDVYGKTVRYLSAQEQKGLIKLDLSNLPAAIYILHLENDGQHYVKKVYKK